MLVKAGVGRRSTEPCPVSFCIGSWLRVAGTVLVEEREELFICGVGVLNISRNSCSDFARAAASSLSSCCNALG